MRALIGLVVFAAACTVKNPLYCERDEDCLLADRPFYDLNAEFPDSDGIRNTCIATPDDCPLERCGCTPGEALACDLDQLTTCAVDGKSTETSTCALGCSTEDRCLTFEPSNGLGPALEMAAAEPDVMIPSAARIDTELGVIESADGVPLPVASTLVAQSDGSDIRVFFAGSFVIDSVTVRGTRAVAFVAPGKIAVRGTVDASASGSSPGPGARAMPHPCAGTGAAFERIGDSNLFRHKGGGGGGNAQSGGAGGGYPDSAVQPGGSAVAAFTPLAAGCTAASMGGGGGGAIQLVSLGEIVLFGSGLVDLGGGGGADGEGGGSGGTLVVEAPLVRIDGATAGFTANGGAGGACGMTGQDSRRDGAVALSPTCSGASGGHGGSRFADPRAGEIAASSVGALRRGGGGGAVGRARIATRDGTFEAIGSPTTSAQLTVEALELR